MQTYREDLAGLAGRYNKLNKQRAWSGLHVDDGDPDGDFYEVLPNGGPGNACPAVRVVYKKGLTGTMQQYYIVPLAARGVPVRLEWDWMFEADVDVIGNLQQGHNGGKISGALQMGSVASGPSGGIRGMWWIATNPANCHAGTIKQLNPDLQDQRSGAQLRQPPLYIGSCAPNEWHHFAIEGLPGHYVKHEYDHKLVSIVEGAAHLGNSRSGDQVLADFRFFSGGNGIADAPLRDWHGRRANTVITVG